MDQGSQTAGEPLYALDVEYRAHVVDGRDFFRVGFDVALGHDVSEQLPLWNPKNTFFRIQFDDEPLEIRECGGQVCDQVASLSHFHNYVIYIDGDCWFWLLDLVRLVGQIDLIGEASLHAPLMGGASVL